MIKARPVDQETTIHFQTADDLIACLRAYSQDGEFAFVLCLQSQLDNAETFARFLVHTKCSWFFACGENPVLMEYIIDQADGELSMSDQQYRKHYGREVLLTIASDDTLNGCIEEARLITGNQLPMVVAIQSAPKASAKQ